MHICIFLPHFHWYTYIFQSFNGKKYYHLLIKKLLGKQTIFILAAKILVFIENYFLITQFYAILSKVKLCKTNLYWKSKLFWMKWKLLFKNMFCKNLKPALKICFIATENIWVYYFVAKLLDAIWEGLEKEEKCGRKRKIATSSRMRGIKNLWIWTKHFMRFFFSPWSIQTTLILTNSH